MTKKEKPWKNNNEEEEKEKCKGKDKSKSLRAPNWKRRDVDGEEQEKEEDDDEEEAAVIVRASNFERRTWRLKEAEVE